MFLIGELSQRTDTSRETIRFYETSDLLPPPKRAGNGYRLYSEDDVEKLNFIRRARSLDFSIDEVREILAFRDSGDAPCLYVMSIMDERIRDIEKKIVDLKHIKQELEALQSSARSIPFEDLVNRGRLCHVIENNMLISIEDITVNSQEVQS